MVIEGRIKDMVIRGGENIYPREIEEFLYTHPAIQDVQVIGVPDAKYGEELMACIILKPGAAPLDAAEPGGVLPRQAGALQDPPLRGCPRELPHDRVREDPQGGDARRRPSPGWASRPTGLKQRGVTYRPSAEAPDWADK